jgi:outer membrane lipoprotein SlyB
MTTPSSRIHPLVAGAAISVIVVSLVGVAAITGHLPSAHGTVPASADTSSTAVPSTSAAPRGALASDGSTVPTPTGSMAAVPPVVAAAVCHSCGTVESVQAIEHKAQPSGVGVVAGALLGGVVGNRFGGGNGRALSTVAGAVGGGYAGNEIEKNVHHTTTYQVRVKMEDGKIRTFSYNTQPNWSAGDQVKVVEGALTARG